jgi:glycosyltransferase involved in cell wall biosynthesis
MRTDLILHRRETHYDFRETAIRYTKPKNKSKLPLQSTYPEVVFITSFPPRECGIATYSYDLVKALTQKFDTSFTCVICALESGTEKHDYAAPPRFILNTDSHHSYVKTAFQINRDTNIKLVVVQHEFGFFASNEEDFMWFLQTLSKPIAFVFHTVLPHPDYDFREKVIRMAAMASSIVVMTANASAILISDYGISGEKISIIPHGTHLVLPLEREKLKDHYDLANRKVLSTFGLLGSSKSIETTLKALPAIIEAYPDVLFLVLGKTHPALVKREGEKYRLMLEGLVSELQIENHVRFVNEYLQLPVLLEYLQLSDIYLFTSNDPNQAVSGTFSYALSCGCPVISTPIPHAKEVLGEVNGIIFGFDNVAQLTHAVISLLDNSELRETISMTSFHKMASTAWQNSAISHARLFSEITLDGIELNYRKPEISLSHIRRMTTDFGMIQFAKIANPDIHTGYTLDDNARALIALCQNYELFRNPADIPFIYTYLEFIEYCLQDNGVFLNYVNEQKEFTRQNYSENIADSTGRAMWALGYVSSLTKVLPFELPQAAGVLFQRALSHLHTIHSTRAMAFIIKGLHYQNKPENLGFLEVLAHRMERMYKHEKSNEWHWFENSLTYGNSLLSEALLLAYLSTSNEEFKRIARESFMFLLSKILVDGKIKVISNKGWHVRDNVGEASVGGEQPIDVAYTIMALERFYAVFKTEEFRTMANGAFNWFMGDNHLHQIVYNPCTGGCYDGVEEWNVNLNQGAESTISYLMARLAIYRINAETDHAQSPTEDRLIYHVENNEINAAFSYL